MTRVASLGEKIKGYSDFFLSPNKRKKINSFGGPFNNQIFRQQIFLDIIKKIEFHAIVETGTFRGNTTDFMHRNSGLPVYTVEAQGRYHTFSKLRFRNNNKINLFLNDSRVFLGEMTERAELKGKCLFFYLDAHWEADLPLREEIELIFKHWPNAVVMVDDFKVPYDDGYDHDDYGQGKVLDLEYLKPLDYMGLAKFFPTGKSEKETGFKRGCIVLAKDNKIVEKVQSSSTLTRYDG